MYGAFFHRSEAGCQVRRALGAHWPASLRLVKLAELSDRVEGMCLGFRVRLKEFRAQAVLRRGRVSSSHLLLHSQDSSPHLQA